MTDAAGAVAASALVAAGGGRIGCHPARSLSGARDGLVFDDLTTGARTRAH